MSFSPENKAELDRIRREYARREREIPKDFYSLDQPGNRFIYESRLREVKRLYCVIRLKRITLAPPLARALASKNESLCRVLERLQLLNTHYLAVIRRKSDAS